MANCEKKRGFIRKWWHKKHRDIAIRISKGEFYVNRINTRTEVLGILVLFLIVNAPIVIVYITKGDIYKAIFFVFFITGILSFVIGIVAFPIYKFCGFPTIKKYILTELEKEAELKEEGIKKEDIGRVTRDYLGTFFAPMTRQIMSIGVIPIIFAIVGIILSVEHEVPTKILGVEDPLLILIILGGLTEAVAFFFGFIFPEPEIPPKVGPGQVFDEKYIDYIIKKKPSKDIEKGLMDALNKMQIEVNYKKKEE